MRTDEVAARLQPGAHRLPTPAPALAALVLALLAGCAAAPSGSPADPPGSSRGPASFAEAVAASLPATVGVYAMPLRSHRRGALPEEDLLDPPQVGAGFVFEAGGLIVTAAHVVKDTQLVAVRLGDGRVARAEPIALDEDVDVALLQLRGERLPLPLALPRLGRSSRLRPGDWVLAVGEPFGLGRSVSAGIVGSTERHFVEDDEVHFIQSDVSVNPGHSGGPLLDVEGAIVGMNVRIVAGQFGTSGVGLSLPIELVLQVARELKDGTRRARPRLGADFVDLSPLRAVAHGQPDVRGALIRAVHAGSRAEAIGLRVDDVVVAFEGEAVASGADLARRLLAWTGASDPAVLVLRQGERVRLPQAAPAAPPGR